MKFEKGFYRKAHSKNLFYIHKRGWKWVAEDKNRILWKKSLFKTWGLEKINPKDYDSLEGSDAEFVKSKLEQIAKPKEKNGPDNILEDQRMYVNFFGVD